jgi:hypothetical protein
LPGKIKFVLKEFLFGFGVKNESQGFCKKNLCEVQGRAPQGHRARDL